MAELLHGHIYAFIATDGNTMVHIPRQNTSDRQILLEKLKRRRAVKRPIDGT
jgi:hypothetical protein